MNLSDVMCAIRKVGEICEESLAIRPHHDALFYRCIHTISCTEIWRPSGGEGVKNISKDLDGCDVEQDF